MYAGVGRGEVTMYTRVKRTNKQTDKLRSDRG